MLESSEIRLLTEIGFLAGGRGQFEQARTIFDALIQLRPERAFPYVGLAMALLNAGRADEAVARLASARQSLESVIRAAGASPNTQALRDEHATLSAYYGLALQMAGHSAESSKILGVLAHRTGDDPAGRIARSMLGLQPVEESAP